MARITTDEPTNSLGLRLFDGSVYEREKNRVGFSQTKFNIYDFKLDLDALVGPVRQQQSGPKEMPLSDLLATMADKQSRGMSATPERMELHQRISFGFVPLIFCLLGVSLILVPRTSRANRSWGLLICVLSLVGYYALLSLGKALGDKNVLHPVLALWLPNLVLSAIGFHFFKQARRETPFFLPRMFEHAADSAGRITHMFRARVRN